MFSDNKKAIVIGAGFGGLSAAAYLAKAGYETTILEKHNQPGGRVRTLEEKGFKFDIGPSWYMMPNVFEKFFADFGKKPGDYFKLKRLDPSYKIFFEDEEINISADINKTAEVFEKIEPGAGAQLLKYTADAKHKYDKLISGYVYSNFETIFKLLRPELVFDKIILDLFKSYDNHVKGYFKNPKLVKALEWIVTFLGGAPYNIPAIYSLINYADLGEGIWYPEGGMFEVTKGLVKLNEELGVKIELNQNVKSIDITNGVATSVTTDKGNFKADVVVSNADYAFTETKLLPEEYQTYKQEYWEKRTYSPSCLLFFMGLNRKISDKLEHHTLFLTDVWEQHFDSLYKNISWPKNPLYYVSVTSKSDNTVAPKGMDNLFILIPLAANLEDTPELRQTAFDIVIADLEKRLGEDLKSHIVVNHSYGVNDLKHDYNSFKGHGFGLAHTFWQSVSFRPKIKSAKVANLVYSGCMTLPGISMPLSLVSGQIAAEEIIKKSNARRSR